MIKTPTPFGYDLWKHLHDEHGLTLMEDDIISILNAANKAQGLYSCKLDHPKVLSTGDKCLLCEANKTIYKLENDIAGLLMTNTALEMNAQESQDKLEKHYERHSTRRAM